MTNMRIIINGFHNNSQIEIINGLVAKFNFEYINHISSDGIFINSAKKNLIIETNPFYTIGDGFYDLTKCEPLDRELMEKMLPYEATIIKMMDRLELYSNKGYGQYKKRYNLYLKHLQYWNHIIKEKNINLFISQNIPHEVYDYVIYSLCKIYEIPVLFFPQIQIHDATLALSDINNWQKNILPEYERLTNINNTSLQADIELSGNALSEWSLRKKDIKPFYMAQLNVYPVKGFSGNKNRLKKFFNPIKLTGFISFLILRKIKNKILRHAYLKVAQYPNFSKKYIYFPMHLQPELTTCPLGGAMTNQELAIDIIAHSLPEDVYLYIKENPKQQYFCRDFKYYSHILSKHKNIIFALPDTDTFKLTGNSLAVATFTGTAGWEALFKQKPVLVFGDCFYDSAPGVFKIKKIADCEQALKGILSGKFNYEEKKLKIFLQAVSNISINSCSDPDYFAASSIGSSESNENLYKFLENYLTVWQNT